MVDRWQKLAFVCLILKTGALRFRYKVKQVSLLPPYHGKRVTVRIWWASIWWFTAVSCSLRGERNQPISFGWWWKTSTISRPTSRLGTLSGSRSPQIPGTVKLWTTPVGCIFVARHYFGLQQSPPRTGLRHLFGSPNDPQYSFRVTFCACLPSWKL